MRVIASLLFLLAAGPAAALSWETTNLGNETVVRPARVATRSAGTLTRAAQYELFELYARYIDLVNKRREQHWHSGLLSGEIVEHPDEPVTPARQLEESVAKRQKELDLLEADLKRRKLASAAVPARPAPDPARESSLSDWTNPPEEKPESPTAETEKAIKAKKKELKRFQKMLGRSKGLGLDWSDAVWAELTKVYTENWSITDQARTASPAHRGAIVCSPIDNPLVCFAFDPWDDGAPSVYEFKSWDEGSFDEKIPPDYFLHQLPDRP